MGLLALEHLVPTAAGYDPAMYSEDDLESAVTAGVLTPEAAAAFRTHVTQLRSAPVGDEEHFRLVTGFNDIVVVIASVL